MDTHKTCFFCCKLIKYDLTYNGDDNNKNTQPSFPSIIGITNCDTTKPITTKTNVKSILQISQYLKVPRNLVAELKEQDDVLSLSTCHNCEEICETLSMLCRDFEVTKMKISHYLNLLTDRIIGMDSDDLILEQLNKREMHFSDLQKCIHKKCLLKARKHEDKATPQLILTKCQIQCSKQPQIIMDDTNSPVLVQADEHLIKRELFKNDDPEIHSCPFCNFSINCGDQLHGHINNQHSEQFESYTTMNSNSDVIENSNLQVELPKPVASSSTARKYRLKKCEICGAIMASRNLARHKRVRHKVYAHQYTFLNIGHLKCEFCPLTFTSRWNKESHTKAVHLRPTNQLVGRERVKKCEICGAMITAENLLVHNRNRHKNIKCRLANNTTNINESYSIINSNSESLESSANCGVYLVKKPVHLKNTGKKTKKKCKICGAITGSGNLARHMRMHHGDIAHQYISFTNWQMNKVKCDFCPLTFRNVWNKESHTKAVHLQPTNQLVGKHRVTKCEICGAMVAARNLTVHKKVKHQSINMNIMGIEIEKMLEQKRKFQCVVCRNCYASRESLQRHYRKSAKCRMEKEIRMGNEKQGDKMEMLSAIETITQNEDEILIEKLFDNSNHVEDPLEI